MPIFAGHRAIAPHNAYTWSAAHKACGSLLTAQRLFDRGKNMQVWLYLFISVTNSMPVFLFRLFETADDLSVFSCRSFDVSKRLSSSWMFKVSDAIDPVSLFKLCLFTHQHFWIAFKIEMRPGHQLGVSQSDDILVQSTSNAIQSSVCLIHSLLCGLDVINRFLTTLATLAGTWFIHKGITRSIGDSRKARWYVNQTEFTIPFELVHVLVATSSMFPSRR